jgi:hypothetical protein
MTHAGDFFTASAALGCAVAPLQGSGLYHGGKGDLCNELLAQDTILVGWIFGRRQKPTGSDTQASTTGDL